MIKDAARPLAGAARMSRWWALSVVAHLTTGTAVFVSLPDYPSEPPIESEESEVRFLPPPTESTPLERPQKDRREIAAERRRTEEAQRTKPKKEESKTRGLSGRIGPTAARPVEAAQGAAPVRGILRRRRPTPAPRVTPRRKRVVVKAPLIDYGRARRAAQRTLDSFVGGMTPEEAIVDAQAFVQIAERAAQAPRIAELPRIGRSGRLRRAPRMAVPDRPSGDDGLGSTGAPDIDRVGKTLRMNADLMRRHPYWKEVYDRVQPLWNFPAWAEAKMLQGEVHLAFDFDPETGRVHNIEIIRRSRIDEFDANVVKAVKEAAPFGRVPVDAPAARRLIWPFKFRNPLF